MKNKTYYITPEEWGEPCIVEKAGVTELIRTVQSAGDEWSEYNENELIELYDYHGDVAIEKFPILGERQSFTGKTAVRFYRISSGEFLGGKIHTKR